MIPVKYNIRNLRVRWATTLMTVVGISLVVWIAVLTFGLVDGLEHSLRISGDDLDLIVLRKGSSNETASGITQGDARELTNLDGIAKTAQGAPLCSLDFVTILTRPRRNNGGTTNLIVRGTGPIARQLWPGFKIVEGRDIKPGVNEAMTSRRMARRFENCAIGEKLEINKVDFTIVGYFEANGSAAESEVWTDLRDLTTARRQSGAVTSVNLRAQDEAALDSLIARIEGDERFSLEAHREQDYYADQMTQGVFFRFVAGAIASFLTFGAMFAAANTMYSAVSSRGREIGTLRALGFRRRWVLLSFLLESVLLCLLAGALGCLATLPFNGLSTGTANFATFSEITFEFRFGPSVLLRGIIMAVVMGVVGGLFPAVQATRMRIVDALRQS